MKKIKILLTASGCPGASNLIKAFKNNGEREVEIIGVDAEKEVIGAFWCDKFYQAPLADSDNYIPFMLDLVKKEKPDILFPQSSFEVYPISLNKEKFEELGVKVVVSDPEPIKIANNKYEMYEILQEKTDIDLIEYYYPKSLEEFVECAKKLGWPEKPICFKPHVSKGSRGFRYIDESISRKDLLLKYKPDSKYISMKEFIEIFKDEKEFPKLIIMEKAQGKDYDAMALCYKGDTMLITVKRREKNRWGVITQGELVKIAKLEDQIRKIIKTIPLSYNISIQFIGEKVIEINPRTSTYIYQENLNEPYLAIKLLLGEITSEEIKKYQDKISYGTRMIRYMDQIFWKPKS